jgi:predicted RNA binding protein YcfA (HicA-like mRNA interferase family)
MTYGELKKLAKKNGCRFHHQGSRHEIWENPKTGEQFPMGRHNSQEVRKTTFNSIKKSIGL